MKTILYIAVVISVIGNFLLPYLPKGSYYIMVSFLISLLCLYLYLSEKKSFVCFLLFALSLNNLADEIFFDPTVTRFSELLILPAILIVWLVKVKFYDTEVNG